MLRIKGLLPIAGAYIVADVISTTAVKLRGGGNNTWAVNYERDDLSPELYVGAYIKVDAAGNVEELRNGEHGHNEMSSYNERG